MDIHTEDSCSHSTLAEIKMPETSRRWDRINTKADFVWRVIFTAVISAYIVYSLHEIKGLKYRVDCLQTQLDRHSLVEEETIDKGEHITRLDAGKVSVRDRRTVMGNNVQVISYGIESENRRSELSFAQQVIESSTSRPERNNRKSNKRKPESGIEYDKNDKMMDMENAKSIGTRRAKSGSTFVRWGKPSCPEAASPVYSGFAAAAYSTAGYGGATELQCMPLDPAWPPNSNTDKLSKTLIAAVKFSLGDHFGVFPPEAENSVVECAVCFTRKPTTLMIPGRVQCPYSWRREYTGYLMSTPGVESRYYYSSKNYCVDREPDFYYSGHNDTHGSRLTFVQAGLCYQNKQPCNEYKKKKRIGCAVCSKLR